MTQQIRDPHRRRAGTTMVELALVMPLLLMLLFAIAEFSLAFLDWQVVSSAAREGARAASLFRPNCPASSPAAVQQAVNAVLGAANVAGSIQLSGACSHPGASTVTVSAPFEFRFLPGLYQGFGHGSVSLTATSVMANDPNTGR